MKQSLVEKLQQLVARSEELARLLSDPEIIGDQNRFRDLSKEYAQLEPVVNLFRTYQKTLDDQSAAEEMVHDDDPELREMGQDELNMINAHLEDLELKVRQHLIPKDPHDQSNI